MGLSYALSSSLSGLRATQTGIELVSANVANASTPGYTKKNTVQDASVLGGRSAGVQVTNIQREIDTYVQRQLRTESSGLSFSSVASTYVDQLQQLFGTPGSQTSLDSLVSNFTGALDTLATTPSSQSARQGVLTQAQLFTQSLNAMSSDIQTMRQDAESGLASTTQQINAALQGIEKVQTQIDSMAVTGQASPDLLDQRDRFVNELADLVDIRVNDTGNNFSIYTTGGAPLFTDHRAADLEYTGPVAMTPQALYSEDPAQNGAGTIMLHAPGSNTPVDLLADGRIRSGQLKAYADIRDNVLVEAQTQLDELASSMADALGTNTVAGTAAGTGFSLDLAGVQAGNKISVTYNQMPGGQPRTVTFVRADDPTALPLSDDLTADPNDRVVGIDFSGGTASVAAQMQSALGADFAVTNTGSTVTFDAATANVAMTGANARVSATGFTDGLGMPFFVDGSVPYTGSVDGQTQRVGFSARIQVNPALINDPALLVNYQASMTSGDAARPTFLRDALENAQIQYRTDTGIGGATSPFTGSIGDFARSLIETQASNADIASRVQEGQEVVVTSLQDRFAEKSSVDVDEEMGKLLQLQSAYAANARVISTVKEMIDMLMQM
jgi:flagellar hook-associated protein 1 FlgK